MVAETIEEDGTIRVPKEYITEMTMLRKENMAMHKMLAELEQEKAALAHQFLTSNLRLRVSMQDPVAYIENRDKEKEEQRKTVQLGP